MGDLTIGASGCRRDAALLTRPRFVPPRKEYQSEFIQYIRVGHIEIVLQGGNGNVAVELTRIVS